MFTKQAEIDEVYNTLVGDIETLFRLTFRHGSSVTDADIRAASSILRKWFPDGLLGRLLRSTNKTAMFSALDSETAISHLIARGDVKYYMAAGVRLHQPISHLYFSNEEYDPTRHTKLQNTGYIELDYGAFKNQKRLLFDGQTFETDKIISFVANKLGGAHLDFNGRERFGNLELASKFAMFGPPERAQEFKYASDTQMYLVQLPPCSDIFSALHLEIIAASASFIQAR